MTTHAPLRSRWTNAVPVYHVRVIGNADSLPSPSKDTTLRAFFHSPEGQPPRFDLVFLGLGPEGHTASLFPGTKALHEEGRLVVSNWVGKLYTDRITMTAPVLSNAACVIFLVSGGDKALALKAVLEGPYEPEQLPAQLIRPQHGRLLWLVDQAAARLLQADRR